MIKDYYKILAVSLTATRPEIRQAYRQKAKHYHPDRNSSPEARDKFIAVHEAYEVLYNEAARNKYDKLYRIYILDSSHPFEESYVPDEVIIEANKEGRAKGEKYASDYDLFSKDVLGVAAAIGVEILFAMIFGGLSGSGFLLGFGAFLGGLVLLGSSLSKGLGVDALFGVIIAGIGFLILRFQARGLNDSEEDNS